MHLILTGATGLVGAGTLEVMLKTEAITRISILSRRPVAMVEGHEDKAKVIIHKDYKSYPTELLEQLKDAQGVVWAQGVSQNDVNKEEYFQITHDYPLAAAKAFSTLHPESPFTFVYVSGEGATQSPGITTPIFGRVKGQIEQALFDLGKQTPNLNVYNARPGAVDWRHHPEIHKFMPHQALYKKMLLAPIDAVYKSMMTPTRSLGKVLTELAMSQGKPLKGKDLQMEGRLLPNVAIRRLAGL
ncbi:hypothetical protein BU24DRAFT_424625 [Aaosphaeria arxii CBS 175.79]|uniref:Nucleoside-diphosphate-sugar epimerase n=1 Tax=Aaosphaeria arxii CBS 175.79 TaxID=1450172 RepID=A0A6A5XL65_9PLEO|nr:uncharacterized protein BU24DRAFT_424625 [Aaosphaeria arxii CBS 175.79]KAF2013626.1 hypothetical protein BU24DRAFT_424625 [Aaosphaeria arxii CBS 175.79]